MLQTKNQTWFGQILNLKKSNVTFSKNVNPSKATKITVLLQLKRAHFCTNCTWDSLSAATQKGNTHTLKKSNSQVFLEYRKQFSLLSHLWWGLLIKFMVRSTMNVREGNIISLYSETTYVKRIQKPHSWLKRSSLISSQTVRGCLIRSVASSTVIPFLTNPFGLGFHLTRPTFD